MNYIKKRNGDLVPFDSNKIKNAISKAFFSCQKEISDEELDAIVDKISVYDGKEVEKIQDDIEDYLIYSGHPNVAKSFIRYRERKRLLRAEVQKNLDFIKKYKESDNTANATIDDNANVSNKNMAVLNAEIHKPANKETNLRLLREKIHELYPDFDYKQMDIDFNTIMHLHDASSQIGLPYCASISLYPFILNGIKEIGGLSSAPKNIDSFCGMFVNMLFAVTAFLKGACLYKDQQLIIKEDNYAKVFKAKEFVQKFLTNPYRFNNFQGEWEYQDVSDKNLFVAESGEWTKITKVYRRRYSDKIYKITSSDNRTAYTSKDHIFKQLYRGREFETKANNLEIGDTVFVHKDFSMYINKNSNDFKKGWVIGMLCGDGCLTQQKLISLSVNYEQEYLGDIFNDYCDSIFGFKLNKNKGHRCYNYQKHSQKYKDLIMEEIIGNGTYDKHINIEGKSLDYLIGFLDGILCADGSYSQYHGVAISLTNENLIKNIRDICSFLGISASYNRFVDKRGNNRRPLHTSYISYTILKYLNHVTKKIIIRNTKYSRNFNKEEVYRYGHNALQKCVSNKVATWGNTHIPLKDRKNTEVIKEIETFNNDDGYVYEIETESHWYNCGGFITHNCATPGLFQTMDWYLRKRYGDDYINHLDENVLGESIEKRSLKSQIEQWFQQITYSINQPSSARGAQSIFHNCSIFDRYFFEGMYSEFYYPDGTKPIWETFNWLQKHYLHWLNQERLRCMLTFPVVSVALIYKDGEFKDKEMADFVAQEYAEGNSFFTYISDTSDSLSSCCRLRSQVKDNTFSFTNGQIGEQTGSLNVITLDLNRIVQDWWPEHAHNYSQDRCQPDKRLNIDEDKNSLKEYLITILDRVYKYQIAYKHILVSLKEAGLLPIYDAGFIDMNRQYLTIGVNGVSAAAEWLGIKCNNNDQYADFCHLIFGTIKEQNTLHKTKDTMFNTEFTPCESAAIKLYERDKHDSYWVPNDVNLYTSYVFKPNDPSVSVLDKFTMHGDKFLGEYCDGGQAAHINLDSHLSKTQYSMLLEHAGKVGCKYFTFNIPNCECEDCGFIAKHPFEICPKCGSTNVSLWDRIIGYLTKIKNWSKGRQIEQKKRVYSNL